jgi:hypothetical protein
MPALVYKSRFIIAIVFALLLLLLGSCSKNTVTEQQQNILQQYFEENILNRDFSVHFASDDGTDITTQFSGYTFKLLKSTLVNGSMTAIIGTTTYTGTWSCNEDYSKLVITLPTAVSAFTFLNREWKFTKKAIPTMELAPWGTTEPDVLHMLRM